MKKTITLATFILLFLQLFLTPGITLAGIAYPYPVEFKQPDGTLITILLKGDERIKWAETLDGYSIMFNNSGTYEYAMPDNQYGMTPSGIPVRNIAGRSPEDNIFLINTPKSLRYSREQLQLMKSIWNIRQSEAANVFPTTGNRKLVCILIGYSDLAFTKTQAEFNNLFNQVNYSAGGATGSVKDYYLETSYNLFNLTVTVAGPYTAANNMAYYGANDVNGNDVRPRELVTEAVILADPAVNYADFDNDNDGTVDGVYIIYAGFNEGAGASSNTIWYHSWDIFPLILDGKIVSKYACSSELEGTSGTVMTGIGGICHEFGHVLGALDFYDTDYADNGQYSGTAHWDLMGSGNWNNDNKTPAHHNPYTKTVVYGWASSTVLVPGSGITLNNSTQFSNSFYRYNTTTANEYFLIENKQQVGFDASVPGHGMLIYHVDGNYISVAGNAINAGSHQGMYPVCASAGGNPPTSYGTVDGDGCPFPGSSSKTTFTDATTPHSKSWAGANTGLPIHNITENTTNKTVSFCFVDETHPVTITHNITKYLNAAGNASITAADIDNGSYDNCVIASKVASKTSFTCDDLGPNTVSLTVTDAAGNSTSANATVTVLDALNPTAVAQNITVTLNPLGQGTITAADINNGSSDNCSIASMTASKTSFGCPDLGVQTVTLTVTDGSGNSATAISTVTVVEGTALLPPFVSCIIGASAGTAIYTPCTGNGRFTLTSIGYSSPNSDVQESVYQYLTGNGSIVARVVSVNGGGWAGVQIRETCGAGSKKVVLKTQLQPLIRSEIRQTTNGSHITSQILRQGVRWLKIVRTGNRFDTYTSVEGTSWRAAYSTTLAMGSTVQIGLFSESKNFSTTTEAKFDNVAVTGSSTKFYQAEPYIADQVSNRLIEVFPNPASNFATIAIPDLKSEADLLILTSEGKAILSKQFSTSEYSLDISNLKAGIYILRFTINNEVVTKRLVVL